MRARLVQRWPWLLLGLFGLVVFGPAALAPFSRMAGSDYLDAFGTQWFFWWTGRSIVGEGGFAHTDSLFHPWGKDLYLHTGGNLLDAVLAAPLRAVLGPVAGTNAWVAIVLATNALAGERLAAALGADRPVRVLAALIALVQPFALNEIDQGRPTQGMLVFLGLWLASLLRPPSWKAAVWGGLGLGLAGLGYWFYGVIGGLAGGLALAGRLAVGPRRGAEVLRVAVAGLVAVAVVAPFAWPMLAAAAGGRVPGLLALQDAPGALGHLVLRTVEGDAQGLYVLAGSGRTGALLDLGGLRFDPGARQVLLVSALLVVAGVIRGGRRAVVPALWIAGLLLIASGPAIIVGHRFFSNAVYLWLVERVDLLRRWWWPGRSLAVIGLAVIPLAALALRDLPLRRQSLLAGIVATALIAESALAGAWPLRWWRGAVSDGIECLASAPDGAVLELPYSLGQRPLYHQTVHHKPMLNGMLITKPAFVPEGARALMSDNSFVARLVDLGDRQYRRAREHDPADREAFEALGYRYVIVRKEGFVRPRPTGDGSAVMEDDWSRGRRNFVDALGFPSWEDDELAIYVLTGEPFGCP